MKQNKIVVFVIDDNIPKTKEYVEKGIYDSTIDKDKLRFLVQNKEWRGEQNLQELIRYLVNNERTIQGSIEICGFTHPEISFLEIDKGTKPDVVIYDWEYGNEHNKNSSNWMKELLNITQAFVFVYSGVRQFIPPHLNKIEFDKFSNRFQLFGKGSKKDSIFTSEEFILQYIVSRIEKNNKIVISGIEINFSSSGYIEQPSDILHLENIFSYAYILEKFKKGINENTIESLFETIEDKILFDSKRGIIISPYSEILKNKFNPEISYTFLESLKKFGIKKIEEALNRGLAKV